MTKEEKLFHDIAAEMPDVTESKMFGALALKAPNGKAGVMFWKGYMVFKLDGAEREEALQLNGAQLFDPMDGRPMKEWVQLPGDHAAKWQKYAQLAIEKVSQIAVKPKKGK